MSPDSGGEHLNRASMVEVRLQVQEDEIMLLKSSLADALRKLCVHDQLICLLKEHMVAAGECCAARRISVPSEDVAV